MSGIVHYTKTVATVIICFVSALLIGQDQFFKFKSFSIADGLNTKTVYNFTQDNKGFIWLATGNGLYRTDGFTFKKIESPLDNFKNRIGSLCEIVKYDPTTNKLFILSYSDIQYLDLNSYTFHRVPIKDTKYLINEKYSFIFINSSTIWYGGNGFLIEWNNQTGEKNLLTTIKNIPTDAKLKNTNIIPYNESEVLVTCSNYILFINKSTYKVTRTIKAENDQKFQRCTYDHHTSYLWIASNSCLVGYDIMKNTRQSYYFPYYDNKNNRFHRYISSATYLNDSTLLLTNEVIFNTRTRKYQLINEMHGSTSHFLKNEFSHFQDKDGNIWRGSIHQGCDVIIAKDNSTKIYGPLINEKGVNIEPYTSFLSSDNQTLYVAGSGISGYYQINLNNKTRIHVHNPYNYNGRFYVNDVVEYNGQIFTCDSKNIYKSTKGKFSKIVDEKLTPYTNVEQLALWQDHLLAINNDALYMIDLQDYNHIAYSFKEIDPEILNTTNPYFVPHFMVKNGTYYYASNVGLYQQKNTKEKPTKINLTYKNESLQFAIISLAEDAQGKLWIGTIDYGVWIYNPKNNAIYPLQTSSGSFSISGVIRLAVLQENIYIGTQSAILIYNTATEKFLKALNKENGFFIDDAGYEIKNQNNQFLSFNTYPYVLTYTNDTINRDKNQITFTSVKISNRETLEHPVNVIPQLKLKHPDHSFSLSFTDLHFFKNQNQIFKYRLIGLDTSWQLSHGNTIEYFRLPSGNYILELAYIDNSPSMHPLSTIPIQVMPPFYKNKWFIALSFLLLTGMIYFWYRQKINAHRHEFSIRSDYEKRLASLEMKALRAQMNPHFIFNSINSIQKFIFEKDDYDASQYLTKFSKLIRMILDQSNQDYINIGSEIEMLRLYLDMESLRFDHSFDYQFHIDENLSMEVKLPSMVIQPHIENAIWHGLQHKDEHGKVDIYFKSKKEFLEIVIEDNGIGRDKAREYKSKTILKAKSYGSQISEDRVRIFNRLDGDQPSIQYIDKNDETGTSTGTIVIINISLTGNMNYN